MDFELNLLNRSIQSEHSTSYRAPELYSIDPTSASTEGGIAVSFFMIVLLVFLLFVQDLLILTVVVDRSRYMAIILVSI